MRPNFSYLLPLALLPLAKAQNTVQDLWNLPDYPDYTTNFTAGTSVNISWQYQLVTQFAYFCEDCDVSDVDLWLTSTGYYRRLEAGMDVNTTRSYNWTINIDAEDVASSREWTLRFLPADIAWGDNDQEISSAKFNIDPAAVSPSPTSTPTSSTTTTVPTATTTEDPDSGSSDESLSTGAKAGIGVGVGAGGLIIIALAFLLWRRLRALPAKGGSPNGAAGAYNDLHHPPPPGDGIHQVHGAEGYFGAPVMKAVPVAPVPLSELPGDSNARELDAGVDSQVPPAELDGSQYEPRR
ncbi:hypothetical protein BJX99DRAFT_95063 [Aspergillus californicus]